MFDPVAAKFARSGRELYPWELSRKKFDFDKQFVGHIKKYLKDKELPCELTDALAWLNRAEYDAERNDRATLLWMDFDERRTNATQRAIPVAVDASPMPTPVAIQPPKPKEEVTLPPWAGAKTTEERMRIVKELAAKMSL